MTTRLDIFATAVALAISLLPNLSFTRDPLDRFMARRLTDNDRRTALTSLAVACSDSGISTCSSDGEMTGASATSSDATSPWNVSVALKHQAIQIVAQPERCAMLAIRDNFDSHGEREGDQCDGCQQDVHSGGIVYCCRVILERNGREKSKEDLHLAELSEMVVGIVHVRTIEHVRSEGEEADHEPK